MIPKINLLGWCFILLDRNTYRPLANIHEALTIGQCKILIYPWTTYPSLGNYFAQNIKRKEDTNISDKSKYFLTQLTFEQRLDIYHENDPYIITNKIIKQIYPWEELYIWDETAGRELANNISRDKEENDE